MNRPRSLRRRIRIAFVIFGVVLIVVMVASYHSVFHFSKDMVLTSQLEEELEQVLSHPEQLEQPVFEVGRYITAYVGLAGAGPQMRAMLEPLAPGVHEIGDFDEPLVDTEIHILVRALPEREEMLYMVFDASSTVTRHVVSVYLIAVLVGLLMVSLVGASTGRILADLVIQPVTSLADELRQGSLETLGDRIKPAHYGEEVGTLAEALRAAAERLRGFMIRERQFTANASHELRTPVTVIRGATELLEAQIGDREPALKKPLARIRRAVAAMEETIEVFLALARETELTEPAGECCPAEIAAEVVEQHRRLLEDRPVAVVVQVPETLRIEAPTRALAIVLGNLVANAFRRTLRGSVTIKWQDLHLEVVDTGPGIPEHLADNATERHFSSGHGYGLGLSIVTALCERFGWRLELVGAPGTGARAILHL